MTAGEWLSERQRSEYNGTNRNYSGNRRNDCHSMVVHMSDYKWCHGPKCHKSHTQDRIRGSKGSKVLRTKKVKTTEWNRGNGYEYFCSTGCWQDFFLKFAPQCIAIAPRHEPLETPIEDPKKVTHTSYYNSGYTWTSTEIKKREVDTSM